MNYFTCTFKAIFVVVSIFLGTVSISAADFVVDGIYYNILSAEDKTCAVTFAGASYSEVKGEYFGDIVIPSKVLNNNVEYMIKSIDNNTFNSCDNIISVSLPNTLTSIGRGAFTSCKQINEIIIPESITSIYYGTFMGCSSLEKITLLGQITNLEDYAFYNCSNLANFTIYSKTPPTVAKNTFTKVPETMNLYVPAETENSYSNDNNWNSFIISTFEVPTNINSILSNDTEIVEYYNILGVKVENPTKGLYIKKCGGRAYKVML